MDGLKIFIVEDDPWYGDLLKYHLSLNPDYEVELFVTGKECLSNLYKKPSIVTVDYSLPDMNGKDLLQKIRKHNPEISVIIISGQKDISTAIELIKVGAHDYLVKDEGTRDALWNSIRLLQENLKLRVENEKLKEEIGKKYDFSDIIVGNSPGIRETFKLLEKAASSQITVTINGETGTGKELVAKAIHYHSDRKKNPFIAINVSAIPNDLIESELFGYEKGAFTGAYTRKIGLFEEAQKGTIFLDEIAEMDLNMQTKLLRVLQEREIKRLGGNETIKIDVRVISATHKNLAKEVKAGNFRSDLFYRLMGLQIQLAPLRERGNDIIMLAKHFADSFCKENERKKVLFSEEALKKLLKYPFPGNVRELRAVIELAIILSDQIKIGPDAITFMPTDEFQDFLEEETTLDNYILKIVNYHMQKNNDNIMLVAQILGISRATIYRYIKKKAASEN
ncbi:MAG: sigma-54 dependent transcriptional regulator [Bacteroidota bacterium]